jgi:hypothetical protein
MSTETLTERRTANRRLSERAEQLLFASDRAEQRKFDRRNES